MPQLDLFSPPEAPDAAAAFGPLVRTAELARAAGVNRHTVKKHVRAGRLDALHFAASGGAFFVPRPAAVAYLAELAAA